MTQGRNLRGSCPVFLFMKRPAPNTPKVIFNTPNRNNNTPKVFFVTLRVFTILPSHPPVFARKAFVQGVEAREGNEISLPSPSRFLDLSLPSIFQGTPKGRVT